MLIRRAVYGCLFATWLVALMLPAVPAFAGYDQEGRKTGSTTIDGTYAQITGNGFSAEPHQCVIYGVVSYDSTSDRQIESGIDRCDGTALDPSTSACPGGYASVEREAAANTYYCVNGWQIENNTAYDATTYRTSATSTTFTGHIAGASMTQSGFGTTDNVRGYAWAEAVGSSYSCPAPSKGTFNLWKRYDTTSGWSYVTSSTVHRNRSPGMSSCWPTISSVSTTGGFHVD